MDKTVFYCYPKYNTFVRSDYQILRSEFSFIKSKFLSFQSKFLLPINLIFQLFRIVKTLRKVDLYLCFFGGYHSFLPAFCGKLFNKPCIIIAGGTDCVAFPTINYGNLNKPLLRRITGLSYKYAKLILPVHEALVYSEYRYADLKYSAQGIKFHFPELKTQIIPVYNGYDSDFWKPGMNTSRIENTFLTVASDDRKSIVSLKGIDLVIKAANSFPRYQFTIVGIKNVEFLPKIPENVKVIPPVSSEELRMLYSQHEFYFQLSLSEGFPNALSESMLCGCIPIVSDVSSMPGIVQNSGFVLKKRDLRELETLILKATESDKLELSMLARKRIDKVYSITNRKNRLKKVLTDCLNDR